MDDDDMQMLGATSGPEFEVRFMSMMSVHHTQAVERARAVRRSRLHGKTRADRRVGNLFALGAGCCYTTPLKTPAAPPPAYGSAGRPKDERL